MNISGRGIRASELIRQLQELIAAHGDQEVYSGGGDYPEGVRKAHVQLRTNNPYIPEGVFYL